jgi:hypothetical protein
MIEIEREIQTTKTLMLDVKRDLRKFIEKWKGNLDDLGTRGVVQVLVLSLPLVEVATGVAISGEAVGIEGVIQLLHDSINEVEQRIKSELGGEIKETLRRARETREEARR